MTSTLKKSLREISQASSSLGVIGNEQTTQGLAPPPPPPTYTIRSEAAAHRLLASSGMDSAKLARDSRDLDVIMESVDPFRFQSSSTAGVPSPPATTAPLLLENTSTYQNKKTPSDRLQEELDGAMDAVRKGTLEEYFDMKHLQLIDSVLNQYREFSRQHTQSKMEKRFMEDSATRIDNALQSSTLLPGRALSGIVSSFQSHVQQQQQNAKSGFPARDRSSDALIWNEVSIYPSSNTTAAASTSTSTSTSTREEEKSNMGQVMDLEQEMKYIASQSIMVAKHLQLLLSIKQPPTGIPSLNALISMLEEFETMTDWKESVPEKTTRNAYWNTSRLLQKMLHREMDFMDSSQGKSSRGYTSLSKNDQVLYRAMGALQYLGELFCEHIVSRVEKAYSPVNRFHEKSDNTQESLAAMIKKYVELELGRDVVARGGNTVMYRSLYYCLRSGDACAANEVLENYMDVDPAVRNIVLAMSKGQSSNNPSSSIDLDSEPSIVPIALRSEVANQYHRLKARYTTEKSSSSQDIQVDEYQLACLALLSLEENLITAGTKTIIMSVEDYIFAKLWWAVNLSSESHIGGLGGKSCVDEISQLGDNIKTWGADYFDGTAGWSYALPLILSQQFYTAMTHLASSADQGLLIATHLSLALSASGVIITDTKIDTEESNIDFLRSIVYAYAEALQSITPSGALRYSVCIPKDASTDQAAGHRKSSSVYSRITQIILKSRCFEGLAGFINADGSRMPSSGMGGLDKYFNKKEVSDILELAAEETFRDGHVADSAELLMLSERYGSLVVLLCRQLSSMVGVEMYKTDERQFWRTAAKTFYSIYMDRGRTYVVQVLEQEGRMSLKKTIYILLQLMDSFDYHRDNSWQNCWDILDKLEFFPRNESEMALKVSSFYALDGEIKDIFHGVILIGMEALYHEFLKLKSSFPGDSPAGSTTQQRLSEIRLRVKLLVTFSGLIQFRESNQTKMRINRMEVSIL